jgi:hypothetical protein
LKDLIVSGASGIKNIGNSSRQISSQGPAPNNNIYFSQINNDLPISSSQISIKSPSPYTSTTNNNTDYNSPSSQIFVKNEQKKMVNERVYPISDYYTSLVNFPLPNTNQNERIKKNPVFKNDQSSNFSPSSTLTNISHSSPSFSTTLSINAPSASSNNNINLLMTPGLLRNNLNDSWMSNPKTPSRDYEPLPPDLGSFHKFD